MKFRIADQKDLDEILTVQKRAGRNYYDETSPITCY